MTNRTMDKRTMNNDKRQIEQWTKEQRTMTNDKQNNGQKNKEQ